MMPRLLAYSALGILLFVGYQWWSRQQQALQQEAPPPVETPASPPKPNADLSVTLSDPAAQPIVRQGGTPLMIPVKVSGSPHAAALNEINTLIQQGKDAEAEAKLQALPPDALNDPAVRSSTSTLWNNLGVMRVKAGGAAAGVPAYKSALAINPYNAIAHHNLVYAYWELKDPALTPALLEDSIKLNPDNPLPHLALAELLLNKDDLAGARAHLEQAKDHMAESPNLQVYLGRLIARVVRWAVRSGDGTHQGADARSVDRQGLADARAASRVRACAVARSHGGTRRDPAVAQRRAGHATGRRPAARHPRTRPRASHAG